MAGMRPVTSRALLSAVLVVSLLLAGCTKDEKGTWKDPGSSQGGGESAAALAVTPAADATDVAVSAEIGWPQGTTASSVKLVDPAGAEVAGALRPDGTSWVPASPLKYTTKYTATVEAKGADGKAVKGTTSFTTMARPGNRMGAQIFMSDNVTTYGQAMPIVVEFRNGGVPKAQRATVEKRLFVTSDPPQPGVWHWDSDIQVEYRPPEYWQPGTKLTVRLGLGGLPLGDGRFGETDITIKAAIDKTRRSIVVDDATKTLTATQDGQTAFTAPVSLGKPENPSFSGKFVVIERLEKTVFDSGTYGVPANSADGYRTDIQYAERLTWDGQFIHAAPWSVGDQGRRNVSHGCVNVSLENGKRIYEWLRVGDPVEVKGTGRKNDKAGNGWVAWDMSWEEFKKGSALPQ